jgi:hypothetical protein
MIVFFVVVAWACLLSLGMVPLTLPGNSTRCLSSDHCTRDVWHMYHNGFVFSSFLLLLVLVVVVCMLDWLCGVAQRVIGVLAV